MDERQLIEMLREGDSLSFEILFQQASDAQVWPGIQTYTYPEGAAGEVGMTPEMVLADAQVVRNTDCSGVVLFRYALGEFPDLSEFWE